MSKNKVISPLQVGKNISMLREAFGLRQTDLADLLEVTKANVCQIENGRRLPGLHTVYILSEIFHVTMDEIVKGKIS